MRIHNYTLKDQKPQIISDLIRVGNKKKDGGYILSERQIPLTKVLIGLGIHYDWSFEEEFKAKQRDAVLYCYDFSVGKWEYIKGFILSILIILSPYTYANVLLNRRKDYFFLQPFKELKAFFKFSSFFQTRKGNFFFQKGISDYKTKKFITIKDMFDNVANFNSLQDDSVYLKMDIEGSEYDVLEDILKYSDKINGMVIEFHNLKQLWTEFNFLCDLLKEQYELIHLHGNNCCGCIDNTDVPNLIELSFIKRKLMSAEELKAANNQTYPIPGLDKPNLTNKPDLKLSFN